MDIVIQWAEQLKTAMLTIAASAAVIGVVGLGIMYVLSSVPFLKEWRESNPKAMTHVVTGLIILALVGSGAVALLLPSG